MRGVAAADYLIRSYGRGDSTLYKLSPRHTDWAVIDDNR
jgi:hypothetical protein